MELQRIYKDSDFSNAVIPEGTILTYLAEEDGHVVIKTKNENNETISMSGGGADVTLGQIDANGDFQPLSFNGTEASNDGSPETVESYYGWNGVLPSPSGGIKVIQGGPAVYYKCASVDTTSKTWSGYLAVLTDGVYTFEETATTGLSYGEGFTPAVNGIYNDGALVSVFGVWGGSLFEVDTNTIAYLNFNNGELTDAVGHVVSNSEGNLSDVGYYNSGWSFGGGYIQITPSSDEFVFGTGDFTMEAYIYPTSTERQCMFGYEVDRVFSVCFSYGSGSDLGVFWNGSWSEHKLSESLTLNTWHHVAFVRKDGILSCFVNGVKQSSTYDLSSVEIGVAGQKFGIGRWGGDPSDFGERWQGAMDEIRISNIARYTSNFIPA